MTSKDDNQKYPRIPAGWGADELPLLRERLAAAERSAQVGMQVRTILHEIGNVIQTLELGVTSPCGQMDREVVMRSLYLIKRIRDVVLRDARPVAQPETVPIQDIIEDVQLLIRPLVSGQQCEFAMDVEPGVQEAFIQERPGSLFLILQNLALNATEAVSRNQHGDLEGHLKGDPHLKARISIDFKVDGDMLCITVKDNGVGLSTANIDSLLAGDTESFQERRHGLGFAFVLDTCRTNRFQIGIASVPSQGAAVTLKIKMTWRGASGRPCRGSRPPGRRS